MTKLIKAVAAAAVLATSATGTNAAELSTDVDINLPSIIALYCYDSVAVNVTAGGLTAALGAGTGATGLGSASITSFSDDLGADDAIGATAYSTEVDLNLNNVCAFRALVGESGVSVAVSQGEAEDASGATLTSAATVTTGLGLGVAPTAVSVQIPLDLSDATAPGVYSKTDLFTVTVAAI